jgi:hypothetical protein
MPEARKLLEGIQSIKVAARRFERERNPLVFPTAASNLHQACGGG